MHALPLFRALTFLLLLGVLVAGADALRQRKRVSASEEARAELALDLKDLEASLKRASAKVPGASTVVLQRVEDTMENDSQDPRVAELQAALQDRDRQLAELRRASPTNRPPRDAGPERSREEWLESLKKENPTEYEAFMKRREEARERANRAFAMKADFFLKRDKEKMTEEERTAHETLVALLTDTWKLSESLRSGLEGDERREAMMAMRTNIDALNPLLDAERANEFFATGRNMGLSEAESAALVEHLNEVVEVTSMRSLMESMRGGGRGGGVSGPPATSAAPGGAPR